MNHTGPAFWDGNRLVNAQSIDIETVHSDNLGQNIHDYEEAQYVTILRLVRELRNAYPTITRQHVVAHSDVESMSTTDRTIGRDRELCPGQAFAWDRLEAQSLVRSRVPTVPAPRIYNIGPGERVRPSSNAPTSPALRPDFAALQTALSSIGYSIAVDGVTVSGSWDLATQRAVDRFQRRYFSGGNRALRPDGFRLGTLDYDTAAAIAAVAEDTHP